MDIQNGMTEHETYNASCVVKLMQNALDLIKRLKGESNKYRNQSQAQKGELTRLYKQVTEQKAEIERLQEIVTALTESNPICVGVKNGILYMQSYEAYEELLKDISTESVKEFAERMKEIIPHFDNGYTTMECVEGAGKYLVKEMTEQKE